MLHRVFGLCLDVEPTFQIRGEIPHEATNEQRMDQTGCPLENPGSRGSHDTNRTRSTCFGAWNGSPCPIRTTMGNTRSNVSTSRGTCRCPGMCVRIYAGSSSRCSLLSKLIYDLLHFCHLLWQRRNVPCQELVLPNLWFILEGPTLVHSIASPRRQ